MANANHKARPSRTKPYASIRAVLGSSPDYDTPPASQPSPPFMPWTQVADLWLGCAGFTPGQRVHIAFDYRNTSLSITPDRG